ncbi:MAG: alanine--tRNA ligase, partial [Rickettsiales bacterium]
SNDNNIYSFRVIADHIRASSFLIAEGVLPSNENRGYVLRRIIRRAVRHINQLNYKSSLLDKLLPPLIDEMGMAYPELKREEKFISEILKQEEDKFRNTLEFGLKLLNKELSTIDSSNTLSGETAFKLYDTYGFPIDLTKDILRKKNIIIDESKFNNLMNIQKEKARSSWIGSGDNKTDSLWYDLKDRYGSTEFIGYESEKAKAKVQALIYDNKQIDRIDRSKPEFYLLLNQTPFYGESGGQNGDIGIIYNDNCNIIVKDTKRYLNLIIHHCMIESGSVIEGDILWLAIDIEHRNRLKANHTATHLLHKALRDILGENVKQKGSLVAEDRLRFDISYNHLITIEQRRMIENVVNDWSFCDPTGARTQD